MAGEWRAIDNMSSFTVVNHPISRIDATTKVTGRAKFADDLAFDRMLHGRVLRAKYPHAKILELDTRKAEEGAWRGCSHYLRRYSRERRQSVPSVLICLFSYPRRQCTLGDAVAMVVAEDA